MNNTRQCSVSEACRSAGKVCGIAFAREHYSRDVIQLERGECIDANHAQSGRLQTVLSGIMAFCGSLPDGRRQIYSLAAPGELLCANPIAGLDCWVEALAPTSLCEVSRSSVDGSDAPLDPAIAQAVLQAHDASLSAAFRHIVLLGRLNALERVQAFIADMAVRSGRRDGDGLHLTLSLSREDIGDYLGLNAESVSRAFRQIKSSGDVQFVSPTRMRIDPVKLLDSGLGVYANLLPAL